jgi:pyrroloquinoline quinone biosynthesis protein B
MSARGQDLRARARTQASIAASGNDAEWISAQRVSRSTAQISRPALQPHEGTRGSPIAAVVLTGAEIDQVAGLLGLRERQTFTIHGPPRVLATVFNNPLFAAPICAAPRGGFVDRPFTLPGGIEAKMFGRKVPLYSRTRPPIDWRNSTPARARKDGKSIVFVAPRRFRRMSRRGSGSDFLRRHVHR